MEGELNDPFSERFVIASSEFSGLPNKSARARQARVTLPLKLFPARRVALFSPKPTYTDTPVQLLSLYSKSSRSLTILTSSVRLHLDIFV